MLKFSGKKQKKFQGALMNKKIMVKLVGKAEKIGEKTGRILNEIVKNRFNKCQIDYNRIRKFTKIIEDIAPWWLEEVEGFSKKTGVKKDEILMANCLPLQPNKYYLGGCTSFLVLHDRSKTDYPLLLKIRDEKPLHQIAGIKKIEGTYKYIFGTNIGNIGIAHFLNEKGLAGANNTGSPVISGINDIGLNDCHIIRLVAEKAENCEQALDIIEELIAKRYAGNAGYKKGMIFLFADTKKGLIVENTAEKFSYKFVEKGIFVYTNHFLLEEMKGEIDKKRGLEIPSKSSQIRWDRGKELVEEMGNEKIGIEDLKRFSKDTMNFPYSLCNNSNTFPWRTLSAFIHNVNHAPACIPPPQEGGLRSCSFISNGVPLVTEYVSLNTKEEETPLSLFTDYAGM